MRIFVADLEGVFIPEIWENVAKHTGVEGLNLTTRDISDYDVLMRKRLSLLRENNLKIQDIEKVIDTLEPLAGALEVLEWIRQESQLIILSDTFEEFARPLMKKLHYPTLFCHDLSVDKDGTITGYNIRVRDQKTKTVKALKSLNYHVIAFGDSYNDVGMIMEADHGLFFNPPESLTIRYPQVPFVNTYQDLKDELARIHHD